MINKVSGKTYRVSWNEHVSVEVQAESPEEALRIKEISGLRPTTDYLIMNRQYIPNTEKVEELDDTPHGFVVDMGD